MALQKKYLTQVYRNNGFFYGGGAHASYAAIYSFYDVVDGNGDSTTVLGDIANDKYASVGPGGGPTSTANATYIGKTADGFIGKYKSGVYFLYSNHAYTQYGKISSFKADKPGDASTYTTLCFGAGTTLVTSMGAMAVEQLTVGDLVVTASGVHRPIRWLGHRTIDLRQHSRPHEVIPIRVAAHAFGPSLPARDLYLSPGHPVLVGADEDGGGHLVPIMCLINGTTIERVAVNEVTYWHVELDEHDILLAEGLPAESYIDFGSRAWFAGADSALYDPDMALLGMPGRCRPVVVDGPVVEAERRRLDQVFAMRLAGASAWPDVQNALLALF